jgi:hypothetical protein
MPSGNMTRFLLCKDYSSYYKENGLMWTQRMGDTETTWETLGEMKMMVRKMK